MLLNELLKSIDYLSYENQDNIEIKNICYDSRKVEHGSLFVCIKGFESDGHQYAESAINKGAVAIVCEDDIDCNIPKIKVKNSRKAMSFLSACFFGYPSKKLQMIGITGTNGKTTSTYLIKGILEACGYKVGLIGTNQNMIGDRVLPSERTTPDSLELNMLLKEMVDEKVNYVVMEVSSHSLYLDRVAEIDFKVSAISNITQDHLDFHKTMEAYIEAKSILFNKSEISILNIDDSSYSYMKKKAKGDVLTYGIDNGDIKATDIFLNKNGVSYNVSFEKENARIFVGIPGKFSVYNSLLAISVATSLGIPMPFIRMALKNQKGVKGRLEVFDTGKDFSVIIDYAHTPDGLINVIDTINEFKDGRLITLFGCGGDRDNKKRSIMGNIATKNSDLTIITSDNPRTEDPKKIINDILEGAVGDNYVVIENRKEAIEYAIKNAKANDIILLAGKGHETYQILGKDKIHFDEREIVDEILKGV